MPIPKPGKGESHDKFISRCHSSLAKEYPDQKQRHAICEDSWRKKGKKAESMYPNIISFLDQPWAIVIESLDMIHAIFAAHLNKDMGEIEAKAKEIEKRPNEPYMRGKTKVIPVIGPLAKKMNLFTHISGGTSYQMIENDIKAALQDKAVNDILLDIDSPGGSVFGLFELANFIHDNRNVKPIHAFSSSQMTSAAYLLGSATGHITAGVADQIGSIGVIMAHYDYSKRDEMMGVKRTFITAGKYKATGHDAAPLSAEDKKEIQSKVDYYYSMFVDNVARNRGVDSNLVVEKMAEGRIFIGKQAKEAGLVDRIGTFNDALQIGENAMGKEVVPEIAANVSIPITSGYAMMDTGEDYVPQAGYWDNGTWVSFDHNGKLTISVKEVNTAMTLKEFMENHPELYQGIIDEVTETLEAKHQEEKTELQTALKDSVGRVADLQKTLEAQNDRILVLEKENTLREEKDRAKTADAIWAKKLLESEVADHLHDKVMKMVSYERFISDGEFDEEAFTAKVEEEIKDWESRGATKSVMGLGAADNEKLETAKVKDEKSDDEWVKDMLLLAGDTPTAGNA